MKILKLIFTLTALSIISCDNDDDSSGSEFPTTFTADSFTEKVTKVYTADGEITDPEVLEKFFANNADNLPSFERETEIPDFTIEYLSESNAIVTQFFEGNFFEGINEGLASRNVNIINQDGITFLENEEATAERVIIGQVDITNFSLSSIEIPEDENPFYKFTPFVDVGFAEFRDLFTENGEITQPAFLIKESLYLEENGNNLELFQTDSYIKLSERTLNEESFTSSNISLSDDVNESTLTVTQINNCFDTNYISELRNRTIYSFEDLNGNVQRTEDNNTIPENAELLYTGILRDTLLISEYKLIFRPN